MTSRLLLVRHAPTVATGRAFAADEPIGDPATVAERLAGRLPAEADVLCSPKLRCRQTALAAGLTARVDEQLIECDFGSWEGRTFAEIQEDHARTWLDDPAASPHGGESLALFSERVARWLDGIEPARTRPLVAVTHAGVIRAALVHALGAPVSAFWRIAVAPLSVVALERHRDGWTVEL